MAYEAKEMKLEMSRESKVNKKIKNLKSYFKDMKSELKRVVWPNKTQLINNTVTVLMFTLLIGALIWISDGLFSMLRKCIYG